MVKFYIEKVVDGEYYPNLAKSGVKPFTNEWGQFSTITPYSEPLLLVEHLKRYDIDFKVISSVTKADNDTFYPIALSFFDFNINWFELMSDKLISALKNKNIKILFYYSEGDNPYTIDNHLSEQCVKHSIPREQIKFISANSEASNVSNFLHVVDDEILYHYRNRKHPPAFYTETPRAKKYTALVRMHKYWRANIMATLWQLQLDTDGYFAYGNSIDSGESENDNPIEVDKFFGLRQRTHTFLTITPFNADDLSDDKHNDHTLQVRNHYDDSYINIVLESHMDVDGSGGVFLTEKTFKPIKNSQMFIIFGACGSLQLLRDMGYKPFDHILDNSYDSIKDTTLRWKVAMDMTLTVLNRSKQEIHDMYLKCQEDIIHNQALFNGTKKERLNTIIKKLNKI